MDFSGRMHTRLDTAVVNDDAGPDVHRAMAHRGGSRLDVGLVCFISAPSSQIKTYILILIWRSASLNSAPKKAVSDPDGWVSDFHLLFAIRDG